MTKVVEIAPHAPTKKSREEVERMIACGLDVADIAYVLKTTPAEVQMHYKEELEHGTGAVNARVGAALLKNALKGSADAQKFWLQTRAKWVVPTKIEHTGKVEQGVDQAQRKEIMDSILTMLSQGGSKAVEEAAAALMPANPGTGRVQ